MSAERIRVGFIGLGSQGGPMARRIIDAGLPVALWARRPSTLSPYADTQAKTAGSPAELAAVSDLVCVCVVADADVEEVVAGAGGILDGIAAGGVIAVHSTVHPDTCRRLADLAAARGVRLVDAPVSGGGPAAAAGRLLVMAGGDAATVEFCRPVFAAYGEPVAHLGPFGSGQVTKLLNNVLFTAHLGTSLRGDSGAVSEVVLTTREVLPADCVLVAIGAVPATEWLHGSGLPLGDGVECDQYCQAAPGIYAAGDVASWVNPRYRRRMRIEHRMNATEQGTAAAQNLLGGDVEPFAPLPYFWTDQYTVKIQVHGHLADGCQATIEEGSPGDGRFVAVFREDGQPTAVLGWNAAARMPAYRKLLLDAG